MYTTMLEGDRITLSEFLERTRKTFNLAPRKVLNAEKINEELDERVEKDEEIHRHQHKRLPAELRRSGIMGVLFVRFSQIFIVRVLR